MSLASSIHALDVAAMRWIAARRRPLLNRVMRAVTRMGEGNAWFLAGFAFAALHALHIPGLPIAPVFLRAFLCPLAAYLIGAFIKRLVRRARPTRTADDEIHLVRTPRDTSFPSLHAAGTTSFAFALVLVGHPWAVPVAAWAAVVSFTRYYLGVHYPSDIGAGIMLGLLVGPLILLVR